jgi:hypothetical protein
MQAIPALMATIVLQGQVLHIEILLTLTPLVVCVDCSHVLACVGTLRPQHNLLEALLVDLELLGLPCYQLKSLLFLLLYELFSIFNLRKIEQILGVQFALKITTAI